MVKMYRSPADVLMNDFQDLVTNILNRLLLIMAGVVESSNGAV